MRLFRHSFSAAATANVLLVSSVFLAGCSSSLTPAAPVANPLAIAGNWQLSSSAAVASKLPALSGELSGTSAAATGIFHSNSISACVAPSVAVTVTGKADVNKLLTLTGSIGGGTLTIAGTLAADGKSLTSASYAVTGGSCAFTSQAKATAQLYSPVSGTYAGSLSNSSGPVLQITATLTQTPESDTDGNFQLSGTGNFPSNSCFTSPVSISNSQVTGGSFAVTYTDPVLQNSVAVTGTIAPDASSLAITNWTLTGGTCGTDSGTGSFTKQ